METYEIDDFSDPSRYGVPFARAIDLAEPEIWRAWVCAEATAKRAEAQEAYENKVRERQEQTRIAASRRRTTPYEAAEPFPWWERRLPPPWLWREPASDDPTGVRTALRHSQESPAGRALIARQAARQSFLARLAAGALRAFGRPETGREPPRWIKPHEWANTEPLQDRKRPGALILSGLTYWQTHIFDDTGLPLDQAAAAYWEGTSAHARLGRAALGRRLLGEKALGPIEEINALRELREALARKLHSERLIALRAGAPLPPHAFAPGGAFADVGAWGAEKDVLVRPLLPPRREAPAPDPASLAHVEPSPPTTITTHPRQAESESRRKAKGGRKRTFSREEFFEERRRLYGENPNLPPAQVSARMDQWARKNLRDSDGKPPSKQWVRDRLREFDEGEE